MSTPERDRSVERLLAARRRTSDADAAAGDACLDAADLAAWAEGALPPSRVTVVESHLATCARCQAIVAAFAKAEPAAAPRSLWSRWQIVVPMVVSAAAAATFFVALWRGRPAPVAPSSTIAQTEPAPVTVPEPLTPAAPAVPVQAQPPTQPGVAGEAQTNAPRAQAPAARPVSSATGSADAKKSAASENLQMGLGGRAARPAGASGKPATATPPQSAAPPPPQPVATPPPPPPSAAVAPPPPPPIRTAPQMSAAVTPESPLVDTGKKSTGGDFLNFGSAIAEFASGTDPRDPWVVSDAALAANGVAVSQGRGGGRGGGGGGARQVAAAPTAASTPVRWRILASGEVGRSLDNGSTWTRVPLEPGQHAVAGAAPAPQVCWLVGRAGLVLFMADGQTFRAVTRPTSADLRFVRVEGLRVIVSAVDGTSYASADKGQTWTKEGGLQGFGPSSF